MSDSAVLLRVVIQTNSVEFAQWSEEGDLGHSLRAPELNCAIHGNPVANFRHRYIKRFRDRTTPFAIASFGFAAVLATDIGASDSLGSSTLLVYS